MALFKIFKGNETNLLSGRPKAQEGFCYFCQDTGKFYIDIAGDGTSTNAVIGTNRVPINSAYADLTAISGRIPFGTCNTTATTSTKVINTTGLVNELLINSSTLLPKSGTMLMVYFGTANESNSVSFKIPGVGSLAGNNINIYYSNEQAGDAEYSSWNIGSLRLFVFMTDNDTNGTNPRWVMLDNNRCAEYADRARAANLNIFTDNGIVKFHDNNGEPEFANTDVTIDATNNITAPNDLTVNGDVYLNNETYAEDITTNTLLVLGDARFTLIPNAPTAVAGSNDSQLATTEFVTSAISASDNINTGTINQVAYYSGTHEISSKAPAWEAWTAGTTAGPKANILIGNASYLSAAIPAAGADASGIVTTDALQFDGNKTFKGNVLPLASSTYTLGSSSLYWNTAYIQGNGGNIHWNNFYSLFGSAPLLGGSTRWRGLNRLLGIGDYYRPTNALFGIRQSSIKFEFTTDGGTTWTENTSLDLRNIFNESIGLATPGLNAAGTGFDPYDGENTSSSTGGGSGAKYAANYWTNKGLRITINMWNEGRSGSIDLIGLRLGTAGGSGNKSHYIIERLHYDDRNTDSNWTTVYESNLTDWSSNDIVQTIYLPSTIYLSGTSTAAKSGSASYAMKLRFTFIVDSWEIAYRYAPRLITIWAFGGASTLSNSNTRTGSEFARAMVTYGTPYLIEDRNTGLLGFDSDLVPRQRQTEGAAIITTNVHSIGTATRKWASVYATNFYGNATSANYINLYEARASTTTLNKTANYVGAGTLFHLVASSSTAATDNGKPLLGDANVLLMNWDNNGGYDAQLAISTASPARMLFRSLISNKTAWREVVTSTPGSTTGNATTPIYISDTGVATPINCTINTSVPANAIFTDEKVKQTEKNDNVEYKLLTTISDNPTSEEAAEAAYDTNITLNPSTNTITADYLKGTAKHASAAHYQTSAMKDTGYIKVKINKKSAWMIAFTLRVYSRFFYTDYVISGYNYGTDHWYNLKAIILGSNRTSAQTVIFGYDNDANSGSNYCTLWVAIPRDYYIGADIFNVTVGYGTNSIKETDIPNLFSIIYEEELTGEEPEAIVTPSRPWYRGETITGANTANSLTLKIKSGTTEGTNKYTFNGADAKTLDILQGTGTILTAGSGTLTIAADLDSPAFTGTPTAPTATAGTNTTLLATTEFVTSAIAGILGPMIFKGTAGTGGTVTTSSIAAAEAANKGYTYKVITDGTYGGTAAKIGDLLISDGTQWVLVPSGDEPSGTVTYVAASGSNGITISGSPITSSGTLDIGLNLNTAINGLGEGTSAALRDDYIVALYAGGGTTTTTYHRRKLSNIFKALNSSDITTALGYTPYNSTNPNGYTTNTGTVTSVTLKAGNGIAIDTDNTAITTSGTRTISHADTSSVSNVTAADRTYVKSLTFDTYGHVTAVSTGTETVTNTDRYVNSATFADDSTATAASPVKMTLTRAGSDTLTVTANIPKVSSSSAGVVPKGTAVSNLSLSTKFLREDGTWAAPSYTTNTNTTYSLSGAYGTNNATWVNTLTPSSGSATTSTVPAMVGATTSAAGKAGLAPVTAAGDLVKFLRGDGTWANPKEAFIEWGGRNFAGSYGCIDTALINELGANRFAFLKAAGLTIEYSTDNGSTWTDYEATDVQKTGLFGAGNSFTLGKHTTAGTNTTSDQLRVTINTSSAGIYTAINKIAIYMSTSGNSVLVKLEKALESTPTAYNTHLDWTTINGWSGWNILNITSFTTYGNTASSLYGRIRFTFKLTAVNTNYTSANISKILAFGGMGWTVPSNLARNGHLYSYDNSLNATFPANVTATKFIGPLLGNADTATEFSSNATVTLSGDTTGTSAGSKKSWTITTTTSNLTAVNDGANAITTSPGTKKLKYSYHIDKSTSGLFNASDNSNAIFTFNRYDGNYDSQLGFSSNGNIYYRAFDGTALNTTHTWKQLAFTDSDITGNAATATSISTTGGTTAKFWRGDNSWSNILTGNLELNATSGNSPALLFTRGSDSLTDWKIFVTSGKLSFQSATDASTWTERAYFKDGSGDFVVNSLTANNLTASLAVVTDANKKLVSTSLAVTDSTTDPGLSYVYKVTLAATGKITATKATIRSASTSLTGVVLLSSATDSTSDTTAATPSAVKAAYDLANGHKYWANVESTSAAAYNKAPEVASVKYGNGTTATATKSFTIQFNATDESLDFVYAG